MVLAFALPLVLVAGAAGGSFGYRLVKHAREDADYALARRRLAEGKKGEAMAIAQGRISRITATTGTRDERVVRWYRLDVDCSLASGAVPHLAQLYERMPDLVLANEDASVRVATLMVVLKEFDRFADLRAHWRGHEKTPAWWLSVDTEALLRQGRQDEATALLTGTTLPGKDDALRLLRLARISEDKDVQAAMTWLDQAFAVDPHNADVRTERAMICERLGDLEHARIEYEAARAAEPSNPGRGDMLAEFHHRNRHLVEMVQALATAQIPFGPEGLRLKLEFWSRVAWPSSAQRLETDRGELHDLLELMGRVPAGSFWDEAAFLAMPSADVYARREQSIQWLRVLQLLAQGRDGDALEQLDRGSFHEASWQPDLETALRQTLRLRLGQHAQASSHPADASDHPLLRALSRPDLVDSDPASAAALQVARGPYAFAALCFAVGWNEAGLRLMPNLERVPDDAPSWLAYGVTQALRWNRTFDQALAFALAQRQWPDLALAEAEMLIALKRPQEAEPLIEPLMRDEHIGGLATWMLASLALEARDADRADALITGNSDFAASLRGRELQARAMVVRDRNDDADRLYGEIAEQSPEGALWMVQRARQRGDEQEATRWTRTLAQLAPSLLDAGLAQ